jgi:hypothetical protein
MWLDAAYRRASTMRIPEFCGIDEFWRTLTYNRQKIDDVLSRFDAGGFSRAELEKLVMAARHTAFVCSELVKWENLKTVVGAAAEKDGLDEFGWE